MHEDLPANGSSAGTYDPPELPDGVTWRDAAVGYHTPGGGFVYDGRRVVEIPGRTWPAARPEECSVEPWIEQGEWLFDGTLLVCPGCGLDCT